MTTNQKIFHLCALAGFVMVIVIIFFSTRNADLLTIQSALIELEQIKRIDSLSSITYLYLILSVVPLFSAISLGVFGLAIAAGVKFVKLRSHRHEHNDI